MSTQEIGALIDSVNEMTGTVAGKMGQIDDKVDAARKEMDNFIAGSKNYFVNQFTITSPGPSVRIWKLGQIDIQKGSDYGAESAYLELMLLNGRYFGSQGTRTVHFSASFRNSFHAEHYFVGTTSSGDLNVCNFILARDPGDVSGYYYLYLVQCSYAYATIVTLHENTPQSPDFSNKEVIKTYGNSDLGSLNWDTDIIQFIEQNENVECVYTTRDPANAILTVGKIRYTEIEQVTPSA
ncbi:hypothetical protein BIW16_07560 [Vibrio sp. OULL4]|nr:hypothetical protein BIW16_07560 [Vibrio sp. OULL4]